MRDESSLRLNLSYVLHEPSDSRSVSRAIRASRRFARDSERILQGFATLPDAELISRIQVPPGLENALRNVSAGTKILAPDVGLRDLLPRAITAIQERALEDLAISFIDVDGRSASSESVYVQLFRGTATVAGVPEDDPEAGVFALALVVRPGASSLQLVGEYLSDPVSSTDSGTRRWSDATLWALEGIIRDYADQWTPDRSLWDEPAERGLDEYVRTDISPDR